MQLIVKHMTWAVIAKMYKKITETNTMFMYKKQVLFLKTENN